MATIEEIIKAKLGYNEIEGQSDYLQSWLEWYKGYVPSFHNYKVVNGTKMPSQRERKRLPSAKMVCDEWANLLINEKTDIQLGENDKKLLEKIFHRSNFWYKANKLVSKAFGLGIGAFVVSIRGFQVDDDGNIRLETESDRTAQVKVECVNATKVYPITIEDDEIVECAFATKNTQNTFVTMHYRDVDGTYIIRTLTFKKEDFTEPINDVSFKTKSTSPWFACVNPNVVNNLDINSALGISIYANAIDQLKSIDIKYDLFDNEFVHGKKRTYVSADMQMYDEEGNIIKTFDGVEEDVFVIPPGRDGKTLIQNDTSELRTASIVASLNAELSMLGYSCGFGKGYFIFDASANGNRPLQTATAVISQNSELFRNIHKHEIVIESALRKVVEAIIYASNTFTNERFSENAIDEFQVLFDDSIFEDKESEKESARKDVASGVMSMLEYRMTFFGEDEATAKKNLQNNPTYIAQQMNAYLLALQQNAISPQVFVDAVFGENYPNKNELLAYIEEKKSSTDISAEDLMQHGFGSEA